MAFHKILVAHDFSKAADRALAFAAQLASSAGAELELVLVYPDVYNGRAEPSLTLPAALPGEAERYLHFLEQELRTVANKVLGERLIKCHVVRGDAVKRIEAVADETKADAICVGATGKGAVDRVLLGSVSQQILRTSHLPVLVVP